MSDDPRDIRRLRPVSGADRRLLWTWANDPAARTAAFHRDFIEWDEHVRWFDTRLQSDDCFMWILQDETSADLGIVRFDIEAHGERAVISLFLAEQMRGSGEGVDLVRRGCEALRLNWSGREIEAIVSTTNPASLRTFQRAGFVTDGNVRDGEAIRLVRRFTEDERSLNGHG